MQKRVDIVGVGFDNLTMSDAVALAGGLILRGGSHYAVTPNAEIVYDCIKNTTLRDYINAADLVLADAAGIMLGGRMLGTPLVEKVSGVEFAIELCKWLAANGKSLYLLGARPGVAEKAANKYRTVAPGLNVCGVQDGFFEDEQMVVRRIAAASPDVLFVSLGSPRQEEFIARNLHATGARFAIGLGGTLDIHAGELKRAPKWMSDAGFEWFYRLLQQPSRIGRMMRLPKFVWATIRYKNAKWR